MPIEPSDAHRVTRDIPVPTSISEVARANLQAMMDLDIGDIAMPEDAAGWEALVAFTDEMLLAILPPPAASTTVEPITIGGVPAYDVGPAETDTDLVGFYVHGGGLTMGGGEVAGRMTATGFAEPARIRSVGVDYRMPPGHPYPAPLDDCVAAYRGLLEQHDAATIVVAGASAGGNLAPALLLRARDEGLPMPSALVLQTPEVDLTESGDSFETNLGLDPVLRARLTPANLLYAGGHDLADPYLSPLFGDLTGFPPTFLQTGTRDLFLSNTVRFHRALRQHGIRADLHVFEAMPHGGFGAMLEGGPGGSPEDQEIYEEIRRFLASLA